ncbi:MAG: hypothetical protein GEU98_24645 [Pseudonocardiaceae bacterium]|nr:hypothetical protein [Pseudonocardiaceae bacterium]
MTQAYLVGFLPGAGCDDAHELYLRIEDGAVVDCVPAGVTFGSGRVRLPGFTDAQNEQVRTLAERLGSSGLSAAEQREIQNRVDNLTAAVPSAERPYGDHAVSGADRTWLGVGMLVAALLGIVGFVRLAPKQRTAR